MWTCGSTKPGSTILPPQSIASCAGGRSASSPMDTMRPSRIATPPFTMPVGVTRRALRTIVSTVAIARLLPRCKSVEPLADHGLFLGVARVVDRRLEGREQHIHDQGWHWLGLQVLLQALLQPLH